MKTKKNKESIFDLNVRNLLILILCLCSGILINEVNCQWPDVEKMMKSHYLPSLEVKVHPPDEFQPKVQAYIAKLESTRETDERKLMQTLEKDYNDELNKVAEDINKTITSALEVFKDKALLTKSAEYAINPPTIMVTKPDTSAPNKSSFREIADFSMNNIQKDTMHTLVEDDNKIEKFRKAKSDISLGDGLEKKDDKNSNKDTQENIENKGDSNNNKNEVKKRSSNDNEEKNGPIDLLDQEIYPGMLNSMSFLELKGDGKFAKPISVVMKLPGEPDTKIKDEIDKVEKKRVAQEKKLFEKAKEEFKLISQITTKELQLNLSHELIPFFVVSKNEISSLKEIIAKNFPKGKAKSSRFLQIDQNELDNKFKDNDLDISQNKNSLINFNKYTYNKILELFSSTGGDHEFPDKEDDNEKENTNTNMYNLPLDANLNDIKNKYKMKLNEGKAISDYNVNYSEEKDQNLEQETNNKILTIKKNNNQNKDTTNKDDSENSLDKVTFDYDSCMNMQKKFTDLDLDCQKLKEDYKEVSSFLELRSKSKSQSELMIKNKLRANLRNSDRGQNKLKGGEEDFINVKFSAAEETYPTIEKLVAQMMTRRDLAEKFERLKILEFETNLQKAENEMIQDILHDELYKVMAKYGPAIEGMKEHIK